MVVPMNKPPELAIDTIRFRIPVVACTSRAKAHGPHVCANKATNDRREEEERPHPDHVQSFKKNRLVEVYRFDCDKWDPITKAAGNTYPS